MQALPRPWPEGTAPAWRCHQADRSRRRRRGCRASRPRCCPRPPAATSRPSPRGEDLRDWLRQPLVQIRQHPGPQPRAGPPVREPGHHLLAVITGPQPQSEREVHHHMRRQSGIPPPGLPAVRDDDLVNSLPGLLRGQHPERHELLQRTRWHPVNVHGHGGTLRTHRQRVLTENRQTILRSGCPYTS